MGMPDDVVARELVLDSIETALADPGPDQPSLEEWWLLHDDIVTGQVDAVMTPPAFNPPTIHG